MHTYRKAILVGALVGLLSLGSSLFGTTASAAPANENIDQSIVFVDVTTEARVEVPFEDGTTEVYDTDITFLCTGWFVSDKGHVATAGHCLEQTGSTVRRIYEKVIIENEIGTGDQTAEQFVATLDVGDWDYNLSEPIVNVSQPKVVKGPLDEDYVRAQIIDQQEFDNGDNALLKLSGISDTPALTVAEDVPDVGEEVTAIGYGGSVSQVTDISRQPPSHKQGSVSSHSTTTEGAPVTEVDAAVTQGMSGGPTVNSDGAVIGINSFGITGEPQAFNFVTDTESLVDFLSKNGVDVQTASSAPQQDQTATPNSGSQQVLDRGTENTASDDDGGANSVVWIAGGLVALLIIGGVVVFVTKSRKSNSTSQT